MTSVPGRWPTTPPPSVADTLVAALDDFQRDLGPDEADQTDMFTVLQADSGRRVQR
jgi:hypothetical protein